MVVSRGHGPQSGALGGAKNLPEDGLALRRGARITYATFKEPNINVSMFTGIDSRMDHNKKSRISGSTTTKKADRTKARSTASSGGPPTKGGSQSAPKTSTARGASPAAEGQSGMTPATAQAARGEHNGGGARDNVPSWSGSIGRNAEIPSEDEDDGKSTVSQASATPTVTSLGLADQFADVQVDVGHKLASGATFKEVLSKGQKRNMQRSRSKGNLADEPTVPMKRAAEYSPTTDTGHKQQEKRRKTYAEAAEGNKTLWITRHRADGEPIEITSEEIDTFFEELAKLATSLATKTPVQRIKTDLFGLIQGRIRMAFADTNSKELVKRHLETQAFQQQGYQLHDQVELPKLKRFTVWVPARRSEPGPFVDRLKKEYDLRESDIRVWKAIRKPGEQAQRGVTLAVGLSERAVSIFTPDKMKAYMGFQAYEFQDWKAEGETEDTLMETETGEEVQNEEEEEEDQDGEQLYSVIDEA